jgi:hypothetical protein
MMKVKFHTLQRCSVELDYEGIYEVVASIQRREFLFKGKNKGERIIAHHYNTSKIKEVVIDVDSPKSKVTIYFV